MFEKAREPFSDGRRKTFFCGENIEIAKKSLKKAEKQKMHL
jgi:hypothetical protein